MDIESKSKENSFVSQKSYTSIRLKNNFLIDRIFENVNKKLNESHQSIGSSQYDYGDAGSYRLPHLKKGVYDSSNISQQNYML